MDSSPATDLFDERFLKIYGGLTSKYTPMVWEDELGKYSPAEWLESVKSYTLPEVTELLGREEPPSFEELLDLPWFDTEDAGTYLHMLTPDTAGHHNHLYGGSATRYSASTKGLRARRARRDRPDINKIE